MTAWHAGNCEANGIKIHFTRTGGDKPPVILLHGLMTNGLCWTEVARALENEYDVIMPDARGHGKSSVPLFGYRYEDLAHDVVGIIESLNLHAPILIGHSMGGMTAAVVASNNPKLLRGLVLADPTFLSPQMQREVRDSDVADKHRRVLNESVENLLADARARSPHRSSTTLKLMAEARLQTSMAAFDVLTPPYPDYMQLVTTINLPSLLVCGDSGVVSSAVAAEIQRLNPRFHVEEIENVGHGLHYDEPQRFVDVVRLFLSTVSEVRV